MRALLVLAALLTAPGADKASEQTDLDAARAKWAQEGFGNYRMTVRLGCYCSREYTRPRVVHVRGGKPVRPPEPVRRYASVPRLFASVQEAIDGEGSVTASYGDRGVPEQLSFDPIPEAIDDESTVTITKFAKEDDRPPHVPDPSIQDGSAARELRRARSRWREGGLRDYRFRLQRSCFCTPQTTKPRTVTVRGGKARGGGLSVPDLFGVIADAIRGEAAMLRVRYTPSGMPRGFFIDRDYLIADEEMAYRAWKLRPLP